MRFARLHFYGLLLLVALVSSISATASVTIPINDKNWYFTEYNWYKQGNSYAQSANPGAYFKVGFTGTRVVLNLDLSPLGKDSIPASLYPQLSYSIDDGPFQEAPLPATGSALSLASGLIPGKHILVCYFVRSTSIRDRWTFPANVVRVTGLTLDTGATTFAPPLAPKRLLVYGDSITEGIYVYKAEGTPSFVANISNNSAVTYAQLLAHGLNAEVSVVGFVRQGWDSLGNGHVPSFCVPGNASLTAWDKFDANHSRLNNGKFAVPPDYIVCVEGTNDGLFNVNDYTITQCAKGFLTACRAATAKTKLYLVIPFGGFKRTAITAAFNSYQAAHHDNITFLIDLGVSVRQGLNVIESNGSQQSGDGIHPLAFVHAILAQDLLVAILTGQ